MYKRKNNNWLKHADFLVLDLVCLLISFAVAYVIRHGLANPFATPLYRSTVIAWMVLDSIVLFGLNTLKNVLKRGYLRELFVTVKQGIVLMLLFSLYLFMTQGGQPFSRIVLFLCVGIYVVLSYLTRCMLKLYLKKIKGVWNQPALLIVTTKDLVDGILESREKMEYKEFQTAGAVVLDEDWTGKTIRGVEVVADEESLMEFIRDGWVDEVFISCPPDYQDKEKILTELLDMGVVVHDNLFQNKDLAENRQIVQRIAGFTVLTTTLNYATSQSLFCKRVLDILGGLLGCVLTGILFLFLAPVIYIQSPGPVFFKQERVGRNGKKFRIYKFRSMYMDAEERKAELMDKNKMGGDKMFKLDFDPRVIGNEILPDGTQKTGIGNFMRTRSLDEFPQFLNVLKGDMSLVGTRPPLPEEVERYDLHHRARLATKPGLTGLWQVSGRSDITDFEEVVSLDTEYISNWSIALDIKILCKTVVAVLKKDGSV
ncbi:MAG: sugar transferase [Eubacterium sp.]|nr:sugar transferase [Eubacterium sp.]